MSTTMCDRFRLEVKRSKWAVLFITFSTVLICAQLCRFATSFPFPLNKAGYSIRSLWGVYATEYEHFSFGFGLSLGLACIVWFILYVGFPLSCKDTDHNIKCWKIIRNRIIEPSVWRDWIGVQVLPVIFPIFYSWKWEHCQAYTPHICPGGNGNGTVQFEQIAADYVGIIFFLIAISLFRHYHCLTIRSASSAQK